MLNLSAPNKKADSTTCHYTKKLHHHKASSHPDKASIRKLPNMKEDTLK